MLQQIIRAGRLDRSFYTSLLFDDYAIGNAVALVAVMAAVPRLFDSNIDVVAAGFGAISGLIRAGLTAAAAWAFATRVLGRDGRIPTTFRLTAFAHVTLIPIMALPLVPSLGAVLVVGGLAWFFVAMRVVAAVQFDLVGEETMKVAAVAVLAWFILFVARF